MNNFIKYIISFFLAVTLGADQGMLVDISETATLTYGSVDNKLDVVLDGDTLYAITATSISSYNEVDAVLKNTNNTALTSLTKIIAMNTYIYVLDVNSVKLYTKTLVSNASYSSAKTVNSFAVSNDEKYIFLATSTGVEVVESATMSQVAFVNTTHAKDIKIRDNNLYIADDWGGLKVLDISNPKLISITSVISNPDEYYYTIALENDYLYVIGSFGLRIFDILSPSAPIKKGTITLDGDSTSNPTLSVDDMYAYVTENLNGYHVYDVSNKLEPVKLFSKSLIYQNSYVKDEKAYFATSAGIKKYEIETDYKNTKAEAESTTQKLPQDLEDGVFGSLSNLDVDYIKINLPNGQFQAEVSGISNMSVRLLDEFGVEIFSKTSATKSIKIDKKLGSGTYYFHIQSSKTGEYKILADFFEDDWTGNKNIAYLLNLNETIKGNILRDNDVDYFRLDLTSSGLVSISSNNLDVIDFEIENSYDNTVILGQNNALGNKEFTVKSSGTYLIKVIAAKEGIRDRDYQFKVSFADFEIKREDNAMTPQKELDDFEVGTSSYLKIHKEGDTLFVAERESGSDNLVKFDLDFNLNELLPLSGEIIKDFVVLNEYIYLITEDKLRVINKSLNIVGTYISSSGSSFKNIKINATKVYISDDSNKINVIDVEVKWIPTLLSSIDISNTINDIDIKSNFSDEISNHMKTYLYLATDNGLKIYDATDASAIIQAQPTYKEGEHFGSIYISGTYIYVAYQGMSILYSKKATSIPKFRGSISTYSISDIEINQNLAYIIENDASIGKNYLKVIDIQDQTSPQRVKRVLLNAEDVTVSDGLSYVITKGSSTGIAAQRIVKYDVLNDYGDTKGYATAVEYNKEIKGFISRHRASDVDTFYIDAQNSATLNFNVTSSMNTRFSLYSLNSDTFIKSFDILSGSTQSNIDVSAGEYYLKVSSIDGITSGEYNFSITKIEDDYPDNFIDATLLELGGEYTAMITSSDRDIVKIVLNERGDFVFNTSSKVNSTLYYDDAKTVIKLDNAFTIATTLSAGTYYIKIESNDSYNGSYQFNLGFTPNGELTMQNGLDGIQNFDARHIVYSNRYMYVIDTNDDIFAYNHLLQNVGTVATKGSFQNSCGEAVFYDEKIFINRQRLDQGVYVCGNGYDFVKLETTYDKDEYNSEYLRADISYMSSLAFQQAVTEISLIAIDNDYIYELSDDNDTIFKSSYSYIDEERYKEDWDEYGNQTSYPETKIPLGIFSTTADIESIKLIKNDGDVDFIAIDDQLMIYKSNPEYKIYGDADNNVSTPDVVVEIFPIVVAENSIRFDGVINDMYIDRNSKYIYIVNENSTSLTILNYSTNDINAISMAEVELGKVANSIFVKDKRVYISFAKYGVEIYNMPLNLSSQAIESYANIGKNISKPFTYDDTTFNYISDNQLQVYFLEESFVDGVSSGTYSVVDESKVKKGGGFEGCFIATAAYGSYFESHVKVLRDFRDSYLLKSTLGREFVEFYYKHSPSIAKEIALSESAKVVVRVVLTPIVYIIMYPFISLSLLLLLFIAYNMRKYLVKKEVELS